MGGQKARREFTFRYRNRNRNRRFNLHVYDDLLSKLKLFRTDPGWRDISSRASFTVSLEYSTKRQKYLIEICLLLLHMQAKIKTNASKYVLCGFFYHTVHTVSYTALVKQQSFCLLQRLCLFGLSRNVFCGASQYAHYTGIVFIIYLPWVLCLSVCDSVCVCVCVSQLRNALLFFQFQQSN